MVLAPNSLPGLFFRAEIIHPRAAALPKYRDSIQFNVIIVGKLKSYVVVCQLHTEFSKRVDKKCANNFIERFNKSYRDEVLDDHSFSTLDQVREISENWRIKYNEYCPHDALGGFPPAMYMRKLKLENSSFEVST